jgi:hypothetical protein
MAPKFDPAKVLQDLSTRGTVTPDDILQVLENSSPVNDNSADRPAPKTPEAPNIELDTAMNFFKVNRR